MDVMKFFEMWETYTIALSEAERGRLINVLVQKAHEAKNGDASSDDNESLYSTRLIGREKAVLPVFTNAIFGKTTNERIV